MRRDFRGRPMGETETRERRQQLGGSKSALLWPGGKEMQSKFAIYYYYFYLIFTCFGVWFGLRARLALPIWSWGCGRTGVPLCRGGSKGIDTAQRAAAPAHLFAKGERAARAGRHQFGGKSATTTAAAATPCPQRRRGPRPPQQMSPRRLGRAAGTRGRLGGAGFGRGGLSGSIRWNGMPI